jgi:hypothetical protein
MPSVNDKFKGLGSNLYSSTPEDIADANRALARSLGQIKNVFNLTTDQLAEVSISLETLKGLDLIEDTQVPLDSELEFYRTIIGTGSGANGEMLLVDVIGTAAGWVHSDELDLQSTLLNELDALGEFNYLKAEPNGFDPGNTGNGIYTVMKYHVIHDSYYTPISVIDLSSPTGFRIIPRWTIPSGLPGAGIYGSKGATLQALINEANTEIARIAYAYPLHASQSLESSKRMTNQLIRERRNQAKAGINVDNTPRGQQVPIFQMISQLHDYGSETSLGGSAWILEQVAQKTNRGGQAIVASMREGRNIQRLNDAGIPTGALYRTSRGTTTEQAPLLDSTYTVEEAKNSIDE